MNLAESLKKQAAELRKRAQEIRKGTDTEGFNRRTQDPDHELRKRLETLEAELKKRDNISPRRSPVVVEQDEDGFAKQFVKPRNVFEKLHRSNKEEAEEFQMYADALFLQSAVLKRAPQDCPLYRDFSAQTSELRKAMDSTTTGQGADWIPTDFSARLYRQVELEARVAALFDTVPMTRGTMKLPIDTAGLTLYHQGESKDDSASVLKGSTPSTSNLTLTAKKLALLAYFSSEVQEDSIIDIMPFINDRLARAIAAGWDDVILNSDTASTHQDSDVTATDDHRKTFLGIRAMAVDGSHGAAIAGANIAESDMRSARKAMGKYGVDPMKLAMITGPVGYLAMISQFSNFRTMDKYGPQGTIFSGEMGKFDGMPVIVSDQYRENLNATGVYDGTTTTKTSVSLVHRPAIVLGNRRGNTVKTQEEIKTDQILAVLTTRRAMIDLYDESTEAFIYHVYNVA